MRLLFFHLCGIKVFNYYWGIYWTVCVLNKVWENLFHQRFERWNFELSNTTVKKYKIQMDNSTSESETLNLNQHISRSKYNKFSSTSQINYKTNDIGITHAIHLLFSRHKFSFSWYTNSPEKITHFPESPAVNINKIN